MTWRKTLTAKLCSIASSTIWSCWKEVGFIENTTIHSFISSGYRLFGVVGKRWYPFRTVLRPGWLGLRPGWLGLKPGWLGLRPGRLGLRPGWLGLRPGWLGFRPGWLGFRPGWMAQRGGTDRQMYQRKISPFYRTSSPIGATALPPPMNTKEKVEQGKGTADHLMPLGYLFC